MALLDGEAEGEILALLREQGAEVAQRRRLGQVVRHDGHLERPDAPFTAGRVGIVGLIFPAAHFAIITDSGPWRAPAQDLRSRYPKFGGSHLAHGIATDSRLDMG